jgi:hypothetical protein
VTLPSRPLLALVTGLWMAYPVLAQEPPPIKVDRAVDMRPALSENQKVANAIAAQLRQSEQLRHYKIDIAFQNGTAELKGTVADLAQRDQAVRLVHGVPGVERVSDRLVLVGSGAVSQAQAVTPAPAPIQPPPAPQDLTPVPLPAPTPLPAGKAGALQEPMPVFQGNPSYYDLNPPRMPPYAWPTYAPYNNNSRVADPVLYPYNSWPFIGPCYPFPQIPLGWRKVSLTWEDGYWWYARHNTSHDWWHLRYW